MKESQDIAKKDGANSQPLKHVVKPVIVSEIFGDGEQTVKLQPLATRPEYYIVGIDSGWDLSNYADGETFSMHLDEIYDAIEEEFGRGQEENDDGEIETRDWPALHADCGCSWCEA